MAKDGPTIITRDQAEGQRLVTYHIELSKAREALLKYGTHEPSCAGRMFIARPCNCGWDEVRREVLNKIRASGS